MKNKLTLEQHYELADQMAIARHFIEDLFFNDLQPRIKKSSSLYKAAKKITPGFDNTAFGIVQTTLDDDINLIKLTDAEFKAQGGFIYYDLDNRYQALLEKPVPVTILEKMALIEFTLDSIVIDFLLPIMGGNSDLIRAARNLGTSFRGGDWNLFSALVDDHLTTRSH